MKSGDLVSDPSTLYIGKFVETQIDISELPGNFSSAVSFATTGNYSFILNCYDSESYVPVYRFYKFDLNGKVLINSPIDIPMSVVDQSITSSASLLDYLSVRFENFSFNDNGSFDCICCFFNSSSLSDDYEALYGYFKVSWDDNGICESVEPIEYEYSADYSSDDNIVRGLDNKLYKFSSSGINLVNENGEYISHYFDFVNSLVNGSRFASTSIINDQSFAGVYLDLDGRPVLSCFNRYTGKISNDKAIVIACNYLYSDLKSDAFEFNNADKSYKITFIDYSDRTVFGDANEAWSLLKEDLNDGFRPDMIINASGFDQEYNDILISQNLLSDLHDVVFKCFNKDEKGFNDKASELFYSEKNIYSLIPSYTYRTIVGSADVFSSDHSLGLNRFYDFAVPLVDTCYVFSDDSSEDFILRALTYSGDTYVDFKNNTSSFNSKNFITLLEYASRIPTDYIEINRPGLSNYNYDGAYLFDLTWDRIGDIKLASSRFCGGDYTDVGFPYTETEGSGVICPTRSYMILSTSSCTNESWRFISRYLTDEYQNSLEKAIPVTEDGYQVWLSNIGFYIASDSAMYYTVDGVEYQITLPSEEEVKYIESCINSCNHFAFSDYRIEQIVLDYANQYFDGKITVDEAVQFIDRDVEAYLNSY